MASSPEFSIAVVGGGIAGLTLAIALKRRSLPVTIYEQAAHFGEIGAGVGFTSNAIQAMKICDQGIYEAFEKVATRNQWESKQNVWFDFLDGMKVDVEGHQEAEFTINSPLGLNGVHRAKFLDEMVKLVPDSIAKFGKRVEGIEELSNGRLQLNFHDGSTAEADAVIGCDGLKSQVRRIIVDNDSPMADHVYTYKYAYRGLIDTPKAIEAIGEERATNGCMWMGQDRHVLTFPINHGETINLVAFVTTTKDWPDYSRSTLPAKREEALKDYEGFGPNVIKLLNLCKPDLDVWSIFDLGAHPLDTYNKPRIALCGDAAHATSPHHGAGAGFCIEDSAVMAELLVNALPTKEGASTSTIHQAVEAAFKTFTAVRKERTQWLVKHSRRQGDLYEWRAEGTGKNFEKIAEEIRQSLGEIEDVSVEQMCRDAVTEMKKIQGAA